MLHKFNLTTVPQLIWSPLVLLAALTTWDPSVAVAEEALDFNRDIRPILTNHCQKCHDQKRQEGGLRFDLKSHAMQGGDRGPLLVPSNSTKSLLIQLVTSDDPDQRMPLDLPKLSPPQIALLRNWIDQGAVWPDDSAEVIEASSQLDHHHWSFDLPRRSQLPDIKNKEWVRTPIDHFVLAQLEAKGWQPAPVAQPHHLMRRMFMGLIGLPPDLSDQEKFPGKTSPVFFDHLVDNLLARPGYGERWGRHWLDLVRYGDTNGYEKDFLKPLVHKYRDYVIQAFNKDKPYDRFITEQLAGDELPLGNTETMIALGYYRVGPWDAERGASIMKKERDEERALQMDDMVKTTGQVFLGLTLGCARCHDHKYDPITTSEYYSLVSIFNPLVRSQKKRHPFTLPAASPAQLKVKPDVDQRIQQLSAERDNLIAQQSTSDATTANKNVSSKFEQVEAELDWLREIAVVGEFPQGYFMHEPSPEAPATHLLIRGSIHRKGKEVFPAVPAALVNEQPKFLSPDEFTSRRRLSLARWIASSENPLTARVIVNRVWQYHFGRGIVSTPSDFGRQGDVPTHPQLLDWLADWFVNEGHWSIKKLHRLIMTSSTYRMSKAGNAAYAADDSENRLLWRFPGRRFEVEAIRDSILAVSGKLNHKKFGPAMYPFLSKADRQGHFRPEIELTDWLEFNEVEASRRTIYACVQRSLVLPMLEVLDFCDTTQSTERRPVTTIAPQALTLFNGEFVNRQAVYFADRLVREAGDDSQNQINLAYRLAFTRLPTATELTAMQTFLEEDAKDLLGTSDESDKHSDTNHQSLVQMCRLIFNLNEFVYAD